jgi:cell division septal protein FtsQ
MRKAIERVRAAGWRRLMIAVAALVLVSVPWWAPNVLARLEFFRVRKVEVVGVRYLAPDEVFARMSVDTTFSVWNDLDPVRRRILEHPQVSEAKVFRRLPGTLVVRVTENLPVALIASAEGMKPVDGMGRELPFDPSRVAVDLPILGSSDSTLAAMLSAMRDRHPALFDRISVVRRLDDEHIVLTFPGFAVRATPDLSPGRLADIIPVEEDLARRGVRARLVELDLRFRDQVIARLQ